VDVNELLKFNLNNALIIAGIFTLTDEIPPMEEGQVLLQNGNQKVLFDRKNKLISVENDSTSVDIDAAANTVTVNAQTVVINGQTVTISGDLRFSKIMGVDASEGVWHKHV
jgi:phage baseplate assembly protein gpV